MAAEALESNLIWNIDGKYQTKHYPRASDRTSEVQSAVIKQHLFRECRSKHARSAGRNTPDAVLHSQCPWSWTVRQTLYLKSGTPSCKNSSSPEHLRSYFPAYAINLAQINSHKSLKTKEKKEWKTSNRRRSQAGLPTRMPVMVIVLLLLSRDTDTRLHALLFMLTPRGWSSARQYWATPAVIHGSQATTRPLPIVMTHQCGGRKYQYGKKNHHL